MSDAASTTVRKPSEKRGPVLDVLRELLTERRDSDVLALFSKLVVRNSELERQLMQLMQLLSRGHKNEGVSTAQLRLFLDALAATGVDVSDVSAPDLGDANDKLRGASGIDAATEKPTKQPSLRKPPSTKLPRIDNPIVVPDAERACPVCGAERTCIGHDVTEVIELEPARVVVRVDRREKLACGPCDGELARAPVGDKVVSGGRLGSTLVAVLVVDKYDDGLPLHRQKRRFERMCVDLAVSTVADQVTWATDLMRPLWRMAIEQVLAAMVMHLDATGLPVLDRDAAGGKRLGALWGYVGDENVAAYVYASTGKKSAAPRRARPRRDAGAAHGLDGGRCVESLRPQLRAA